MGEVRGGGRGLQGGGREQCEEGEGDEKEERIREEKMKAKTGEEKKKGAKKGQRWGRK